MGTDVKPRQHISERENIMMITRRLALACALTFFLAQIIFAQAPPQPPKPGREHKKMSYFLGRWNSEGEAKASDFGPGGKFSFMDNNTWLFGGFFVITHSEGKGPMGEIKSIAVMGYDPAEKVYTYNAFNSMGMAESGKGTVDGNTWTWTNEGKVGDKMFKSRFIMKIESPTSYNYKWESSANGGDWTTIMEGRATKVSTTSGAKKPQ
jgi:uncharacterized protein DUF1579